MLKTVESLYRSKDYAEAVSLLEAHKSGLDPGLYHFNLGIALGKLNRLAEARYHFLKAERVGFSAEALSQNKVLVEERLEVQKLEKPLNLSDIAIHVSLVGTQGVFTFLSLLLLLTAIVFMMKKVSIKLSLSIVVLAVAIGSFQFWMATWPFAVALEKTEIQEGPSAIFGSIGELPPGVLVLAESQGEWKKIIYPSRFSGWIKSGKALKELE